MDTKTSYLFNVQNDTPLNALKNKISRQISRQLSRQTTNRNQTEDKDFWENKEEPINDCEQLKFNGLEFKSSETFTKKSSSEFRDSNEKFFLRPKESHRNSRENQDFKNDRTNEPWQNDLKNPENSKFHEKFKTNQPADSLKSNSKMNNLRISPGFQDAEFKNDRRDSAGLENQESSSKFSKNHSENDDERLSIQSMSYISSNHRFFRNVEGIPDSEVHNSNEKFWLRLKSYFQSPDNQASLALENPMKGSTAMGLNGSEKDIKKIGSPKIDSYRNEKQSTDLIGQNGFNAAEIGKPSHKKSSPRHQDENVDLKSSNTKYFDHNIRNSNEKYLIRKKFQPGENSSKVPEKRTKEPTNQGLNGTKADNYEKFKVHSERESQEENQFPEKSFKDFPGFVHSKNTNDRDQLERRDFFNQAEPRQNDIKSNKEKSKTNPFEAKDKNLPFNSIKNISELDVRDSNEKFWIKSKTQNPEKRASVVTDRQKESDKHDSQDLSMNQNGKNQIKDRLAAHTKNPSTLTTRTSDEKTSGKVTKGVNLNPKINQPLKTIPETSDHLTGLKTEKNSVNQNLDSPEPPPFNESESKRTLGINQVSLVEILPHTRRNSVEVKMPEFFDMARQPSFHISPRKHLIVPGTPGSRPSVGIQTVPNSPSSRALGRKDSKNPKADSKTVEIKALIQGRCKELERIMLKNFQSLQSDLKNIDERFEEAKKKLNDLKKKTIKKKKTTSFDYSRLNLTEGLHSNSFHSAKSQTDWVLMRFHRSSLAPVNLTPKNVKSSADQLTCAWSDVLNTIISGRLTEGFKKCLEMKDDLYFIRLLHHLDPCLKLIPQNLALVVLKRLLGIIESDFVKDIGNRWQDEAKSLGLMN